MRKLEPTVKFNGGNPVALCLRCSVIMCYIDASDEVYKVSSPNSMSIDGLKKGDKIPVRCRNCEIKELIIEKK